VKRYEDIEAPQQHISSILPHGPDDKTFHFQYLGVCHEEMSLNASVSD